MDAIPTKKSKDDFVVAIARDPSVVSSEADLIITPNDLEGFEDKEVVPLVRLLEERGEHGGTVGDNVREIMDFWDTNLAAYLFHDAPEDESSEMTEFQRTTKYAAIQDRYLMHVRDIQRKLTALIKLRAGNRNIVINPYWGAYPMPRLWREDPQFSTLAPRADVAFEYAKKTAGRALAIRVGVPVLPGEVVSAESIEEAAKKYGGDVFVASDDNPFSPDNHRYRVGNPANKPLRSGVQYLVTQWRAQSGEKQVSPNSQLVIGEHGVVYLGELDQIIKSDVKHSGNIFPPTTSEEVQRKVREYSIMLGHALRHERYRGFVGFDWIVDEKSEEVWFAEINPRKNRSSGLLTAVLDHINGKGSVYEIDRSATSGGLSGRLELRNGFMGVARMETFHPVHDLYVPEGALEQLQAAGIALDERPPQDGGEKLCVLNFPKPGTRISAGRSASILRFTAYAADGDAAERGVSTIREKVLAVLQKR